MSKTIWDKFAPVYSLAMKSQKNIYDYMYRHIGDAVKGKEVLELATGPGMIAKNVAWSAERIVTTDFSPEMIEQAKKGNVPENVSFEIADASDLPYEDKSFDIVVIANALHVIPNPEKVLEEIGRVLKTNGILIAPNYIERKEQQPNLWQKLLYKLGVKFEHQWTAEQYKDFLESKGWKITASEVVPGRIDLMYAECVRK